MSYTKAIYNGQLIELSDFKINQDNRAFRYGDGFFETIVTLAGKSNLLDYHVKRINKALFAFNLNSKEVWSTAVLQSHINDLLSYHEYKNARIRINFWREAKGLYAPLGNDCHYLITVKPQLGKPKTHFTKVGIYKEMPLVHHRLSAYKTLNSLPYVMAGMHKEKEGWEEVILLSVKGNLSDGGSSNVFWIKEGTLFTPSLKTGCIEGVMRAKILEICKKNKIKLTECEAKEEELKKADALFFSNVNGIVPVQKFASKKYDLQHPIFEVLQSMV